MIKLNRPLLTGKYTNVYAEQNYTYNAPHRYFVTKAENENKLVAIKFQEGPIKECGVNGCCDEDLLNIVADRLEHFQQSEFACEENKMAIQKIDEALMWLRKRTMSREARGVEGTHIV